MERQRGNFTFTTAKVGPKGDPIFDDVMVNFVGVDCGVAWKLSH